jgi:predicted permease
MKGFFRRIGYLFSRNRRRRELEDEMAFHREMIERSGIPERKRSFGNSARLQEQARETWGWTWIDRLIQDLRYGARTLARAPGFTLTALLILAIGIGVNVAAFSLFDMIALKPLPVRDPGSIVRLERRSPSNSATEMPYPSVEFYRDHARTLSAAIAVLGVPPMQVDDDLRPASVSFFTPNYFTELGTVPAYGRLLDPVQDGSRATPAVVLSYGFWQRRFGGNPSVVGKVIHLNKKPVTVVGITPYAFATLGGQGPDLWLPMAQQPYLVESSKVLTDFSDSSVRMWGRLAPGVTIDAAEDELRTLTRELRRQHPKDIWENEYLHISPGGHMQVMRPDMYQIAAMIAVLTLLILAVACANLGGLLLARAVTREHEMGIRVAIGASRRRIFRQLLTESLLLAMLGAAAGLALGYIVLKIALNTLDAPKWLSAAPDWRVLLFTIGVTLAATLFFGLAPALQIVRQRHRRTIARQILMGAQVAASCVLLIVAGLLVRATRHALYSDPGFGYEQLLTIDSQLGKHGYTPAAAKAYLDQMQDRLRSLPGVKSVSLVSLPPLGHSVSNFAQEIGGRQVLVYPNSVAPEFFDTMGIPLLLGRSFHPGEKNAIIVSQSLARQQWPGQNPLGQPVQDGNSKDFVVGVASDAHINALSDDDATEEYWPAQQDDMPGMVIVLRASGEPGKLPPLVKSISEGLDPKLFPEIRQVKLLYHDNISDVEKIAMIVSLISLVAVFIAGIGILGLVAYTVTQRTKEIAIRIALGAPATQVISSVLRQFSWPVLLGVAAGAAVTGAFSQILRRTLYGVSNLDPLSYAAAIVILFSIIAIAAFLPARRALKLDIARTLHEE